MRSEMGEGPYYSCRGELPDEEAQALIKRRKLELRLRGETLKRSLDSIVH